MNLYLTKHRSGVRQDITNLAVSWTWSGDKASLSRQLEMELAFSEKDNLPVPEIGDLVTMEATKPLFAGVVLRQPWAVRTTLCPSPASTTASICKKTTAPPNLPAPRPRKSPGLYVGTRGFR